MSVERSTVKIRILLLLISLFVGLTYVKNVDAKSITAPEVKKSKSGICHPKGGTYYSRTKTFKPYISMDACLKSGGRKSKR